MPSGQTTADPAPSAAHEASTGAAEGAAAGAALGPEGAAAGAVLGAAKKAAGARKKKTAAKGKTSRRSGPVGNPRRALIAEFVVCIILLALSPLAKSQGELSAKQWMTKGSAMCLLFIILSLIGATGPKTQKVTAGFGALVTIALLIDQRGIFATLTNAIKNKGDESSGDLLIQTPEGIQRTRTPNQDVAGLF